MQVKMDEFAHLHIYSGVKAILLQPVVGRFLGDHDIMNMAFPEPRVGNT
jgi:hypothetical protein